MAEEVKWTDEQKQAIYEKNIPPKENRFMKKIVIY